jgi:hypothetical protein
MARGWESKSVEEQVAAAESAREAKDKPHLAPAEADAQRKRDLLIMARDRIAQLIAGTANERYRELLERELKALDEKLAA